MKSLFISPKSKRFIKKIKAHSPFSSKNRIIFSLFALLCGRATLLGTLTPFGGAFFASVFTGKYTYIYMLFSLLGQLLSGADLTSLGKYIFAMTFFALIFEKLPHSSKHKASSRAFLFAFALVLSGIFFIVASASNASSPSYYDFMLLFIESAAAFFATLAFTLAVPVIKRRKLSYTFSSTEEISLFALFGCALLGASSVTDFGFVNLSEVCAVLIILTFSIRLGSSRGAICGLVLGLVSSLGKGTLDASCVSYAFSALCAGLLGRFGAISASAGFIFANALITALANGSTEVLINIYDIFFACIIYSLIPETLFLRLTNFGAKDDKDRVAQDSLRYGEYVISDAERVVKSISKRFDSLSDSHPSKSDAEMRFFERIARRSCFDCGMRRFCWTRDAKNTMSLLRRALLDFCETGKVKSELLPQNCLRPKEMREAFYRFSELYRSDIIWQGKINELKTASLGYINAFSEILSAAAKRLSSSHTFDRALADEISRKLKASGVVFSSVTVLRDSDCDPTVFISLKHCGGFSLCDKGCLDIVSQACGGQMIRAGKRDCSSCLVRYVTAPSNSITFASRKKARDKKKISGDSVITRVIDKSLHAAVLTDGMGFGENAFAKSRAAAEMILDLLESGVSGEKAVKAVNSLMIPFGEASFSSADLCLYNPIARRARIIKCGSAVTFAKSGDRVDTLYSKSMPLGSHTRGSVETFNLSAASGDILVLISDGVLESSGRGGLKDTWVINELENFNGGTPDALADLICTRAMEKCQMNPKDDITVLAACIN